MSPPLSLCICMKSGRATNTIERGINVQHWTDNYVAWLVNPFWESGGHWTVHLLEDMCVKCVDKEEDTFGRPSCCVVMAQTSTAPGPIHPSIQVVSGFYSNWTTTKLASPPFTFHTRPTGKEPCVYTLEVGRIKTHFESHSNKVYTRGFLPIHANCWTIVTVAFVVAKSFSTLLLTFRNNTLMSLSCVWDTGCLPE